MMKRFAVEASDIRVIVEVQTLSYDRNSQFTDSPEATTMLGRRLRLVAEEWIREFATQHTPKM